MKRHDWILLAAILILPGWGLWRISQTVDPRLLFGAVGLIGVFAFVAFGWDKRNARIRKRRISEKTLHILEFFGGWPGSYLGQRMFRHKIVKQNYQMTFWLIVFLYQSVSAYFLFGR